MGTLKTLAAMALVPVTVISLTACGSSKTGTTASTGGNGSTVEAHDFRLSPKTLSVMAGTAVTITYKNKGSVEHNFSITQLNVDTDAEKGASMKVSFTAPSSPGTYEYFCKYHKSKGMTGTLTVI